MKKETIEISDKKQAYAVMQNTDGTEGSGQQYVLAVCETKATATRTGKGKYVMGSDCPVESVEVFKIGGRWYGPVRILAPSDEDRARQRNIDEYERAENKAKAVGLSPDDIKALRGLK